MVLYEGLEGHKAADIVCAHLIFYQGTCDKSHGNKTMFVLKDLVPSFQEDDICILQCLRYRCMLHTIGGVVLQNLQLDIETIHWAHKQSNIRLFLEKVLILDCFIHSGE